MTTYTVVQGDSFYAIADKLGVPRPRFVAANPQVANINLIYPGQVLNVPSDSSSVLPGGDQMVAASGLNSWAVAAAIGLGIGALLLFFNDKPRKNPGRRKRRKSKPKGLRTMTAAEFNAATRIGTSLARR